MAGGAALSALSLGTSIAGTVISTGQKISQQEERAAASKRAAKAGRIKADQADAAYRSELNDTLATIDAIRASTGAAAGSPTSIAVKKEQRRNSDINRRKRVVSHQLEAAEHDRNAENHERAKRGAFGIGLLKGINSGLGFIRT